MTGIYYFLGLVVFWLLAGTLGLVLLVIGWEFMRRRFPGLGYYWDANVSLFSPRSRIFRRELPLYRRAESSYWTQWEVPGYVLMFHYEETSRLRRYMWGITRRRRLRVLSEAITKAYFTKGKL